MFCQKCGTSIAGNASFCASCGQDLAATTPMQAIVDTQTRTPLQVVQDALKEDYDVKEEIGRGGMAIVFRGQERGLGRDVAIKVLPFAHSHEENLVERFENEARTSAQLEHPNIIPIYRVGRSGQVIYFTMRYLSGPSLAELLGELGWMTPQDIRRLLIQSAEALAHAHTHGVVHRDIKPDNIMFKETGEAVLCDFGIAKATSSTSLTATGTAVGTPFYMSPEQVRAQPLDGRSDIYSLGVVAYQCLCGKIPFDGEDSYAIGFKHITEDPPVPELKTAAHRSLYKVVLRMMAKDPADRYQNAGALVEDLSKGSNAGAISDAFSAATTRIGQARARGLTPATARPAHELRPPTTPNTPVPQPTYPQIEAQQERKKKRSPVALVGMLFFILGGLGGGGVYYTEVAGKPLPPSLRGLAPYLAAAHGYATDLTERIPFLNNGPGVSADSAVPVDSTILIGDSLTLVNTLDSVTAGDSTAAADPAMASPSDSTVATPAAALAPGRLVVANLDGEATLWIDDRLMQGFTNELRAGRHSIRIASPGFLPYITEVTLAPGETLEHRVNLLPESQCDQFDQPGYNNNNLCFDSRPRPAGGANTLVPVGNNLPRTPTQPAILNVQVTPAGTAGTVLIQTPSDVPEFTLAAVQFAKALRYEPAQKNDRPVVGWIQLPFYPRR